MTLLIFSSSRDVLRAARAKWTDPRYHCDSAISCLVRDPTSMSRQNDKRLIIGRLTILGETFFRGLITTDLPDRGWASFRNEA
jgi:hypothetical protein